MKQTHRLYILMSSLFILILSSLQMQSKAQALGSTHSRSEIGSSWQAAFQATPGTASPTLTPTIIPPQRTPANMPIVIPAAVIIAIILGTWLIFSLRRIHPD